MIHARLAAALLALCLAGPALAQSPLVPPPPAGLKAATFAAGCFWCVEPPFDELPGVVSTTSGYTDGERPNPTYQQVSAGGTGHTEAVRVVYDPAKVSYQTLLDTFWRNVDPVDGGGQFCDRGDAYRPAIFTHDEEQAGLAQASKAALAGRLAKPVAVEVEPATAFYAAEDYHQDYARKNPVKYKFYRYNCGRDARLGQIRAQAGF